jgi:hypothetical protein
MPSVPAAGASGTITISTNRDCTWSASTATAWISITSSGSGQGEATLTYRVAANVDPSPRHGTVTVNDSTVDVTQEPAPCRFTVSPSAAASPAAGGSIEITVDASSPACAWTAVSNAAWITVAAGARGSGNGTVTLNILPNGGDAREGRVVVADIPVTITQPSVVSDVPAPVPLPPPSPTPSPTPPPCTYAVDPPSQAIAADGGSGTIAVSSGSGCPWSATTTASWITITGGASGEGSGTVAFTAAVNSGAARSATIQIAGTTATITQPAASCTYTIAPTSQAVGAGGGTGSVTVTAGANCAWSVTKDASWISITSGATGTGNGTVQFSVSSNPGAARSARLTIAGRTFTVTQAASTCTFAIAPRDQGIGAGGGTGTVAVTAANGCSWHATANANWLTITSPASGNGNGSITFSAAPNTGPPRSGTLTVAGETFTVEQDGGTPSCTFSLSAANLNVAAAGGTGSVTVTAGATCAWNAASNAGWITVTSETSGRGIGTVSFAVAANAGAARSGTLTIAGRTFTVMQEAGSCSYAISPSNQNVAAVGGSGSVAVTTAGGCAWTATSNALWILVLSGSPGTGNGTVAFAVLPNIGAGRSGTLTIAGQTFTVTQEALVCTYSVTPTSRGINPHGGTGTVNVSAGSGCSWTARSNADWLSITDGSSGTGNGSVTFSADRNRDDDPRTGTLTIAGQTVTIMQPGS